MALSVWLFGTGGKRANIFKDIYFTVEDVDGIGVIYTKLSEYGAVIKINNPVQKFSADVDSYYSFTALMTNVMKTLGDGYAVQKQDIFVRKQFSMPESDENSYLTNSYFRFFDGRTYVDCDTYLIIVQENKKSALMSFDAAKWRDFLVKINKVKDQLIDGGIKDARFLSVKECKDYVDRYFAMNFRDRNFSMTNFKVDSDVIGMGERQMKMFSLIDVDNAGLPGILKPYVDMNINNSMMPVDIMSELDKVPEFDTMVYNQILFLPNQKRELSQLEKKKNRHTGIPSPGNLIAAEDIGKVLDVIAREGHQLVYSHFSLAVSIS
ncbi:MAG: conjugal transfer protein TraG, partial [Prevotella sp.]|nr:conjugal transfer protein TraG [Prevotella sp.]